MGFKCSFKWPDVFLMAALKKTVLFLQTVLRIWDCLFYEGSKVLFRVALTLIHHNQAVIEQARSLPDVCEAFKRVAQGPFVEECHTFMQVGGIINITLEDAHFNKSGSYNLLLVFLNNN